MNTQDLIIWLRYPAYELYHLSSLNESVRGNYPYDIVPTFTSALSKTEQQAIIEALEWVLSTNKVDFEDVLPELPHPTDFKLEHFRITKERILKALQEFSADNPSNS